MSVSGSYYVCYNYFTVSTFSFLLVSIYCIFNYSN